MSYIPKNTRTEKYIDSNGFLRTIVNKKDLDEINKRIDNLVISGDGGTCLSQTYDFKPFQQITEEDWNLAIEAGVSGLPSSKDMVSPMPVINGINVAIESTMSTAFRLKHNHEARIETLEGKTITSNKIGRYKISKPSDNQLTSTLVTNSTGVLTTLDNLQTDLREVMIPFVNDSRNRIVNLEDNKGDVDTMLTEWTNGKKDLNNALTRIETNESNISSINGDISSIQNRITILEGLDGQTAITVGPQRMGSNGTQYVVERTDSTGTNQSQTLIYGEDDTLDYVIDKIHEIIQRSVTDLNGKIGTGSSSNSDITLLQNQVDTNTTKIGVHTTDISGL